MKYILRSIMTFSFWKYAIFSKDAMAKVLATTGVIYLFMELMDFLDIYTKARYGRFAIIPIALCSIGFVVYTRRPVTRVSYRARNKDYKLDVKIGDIFLDSSDIVISTNTTFDTNISSGLISKDSLQGQLALQVFQGNTSEIDRQLDLGLKGVEFAKRREAPGKENEYPIGTVSKVISGSRVFYFVAMSCLNEHGTAKSTLRDVEDALSGLWKFVAEQGELRSLAIPLMGTGRGRIEYPRKKMVERIAQSFADASRNRVFSNRLTIFIRPEDADNFEVNLFEVKDYLTRSLIT